MRKISRILVLLICIVVSFSCAGCNLGCARKEPTDISKFELTLIGDEYSIKAKENVSLPSVVMLPSEYNGKPITMIGDLAFKDCQFTKICIPDSYKVIGGYAFKNCVNLSSIEWSSNIEEIKQGAFSGCTGLVNTIVLPKGLKIVGDNCFELCANLTKVKFPASMISYGNDVFIKCGNVTLNLDFNNAVYKLENNEIVPKN